MLTSSQDFSHTFNLASFLTLNSAFGLHWSVQICFHVLSCLFFSPPIYSLMCISPMEGFIMHFRRVTEAAVIPQDCFVCQFPPHWRREKKLCCGFYSVPELHRRKRVSRSLTTICRFVAVPGVNILSVFVIPKRLSFVYFSRSKYSEMTSVWEVTALRLN